MSPRHVQVLALTNLTVHQKKTQTFLDKAESTNSHFKMRRDLCVSVGEKYLSVLVREREECLHVTMK